MLTGINAKILGGYTGADHLLTSEDATRVVDAVAGQSFRRASDALRAAETAFLRGCDYRVRTAHILVSLRTACGEKIEIR